MNQNLHAKAYLRKHPKLRKYDFRVAYRLPTVKEWELAASGANAVTHPYGDIFPPLPASRLYRKQLVRVPAEADSCLKANGFRLSQPVLRLPFNVREHFYVGEFSQAFNCPVLDKAMPATSLTDGMMLTDYLYAYPPSARGFYNMIGNVAELTATPGIAKGGSFWQSVSSCTVQTNLPYTQPQMWLGFRCAATVFISTKR